MSDVVIAKVLFGLIGLWAILSLISLYKGIRKKRLFYSFKNTINSTRWGLSLVWSAYFTLGALILLEPINKWVEHQQLSITSPLGRDTLFFFPLVYLVTIVCVICVVMWNASKPFIQYNEKEKEWLKEDTDKWEARFPKWVLKIIKS